MKKKKLGAYYTPKELALFVIKHLSKTIKNNAVSVLEPSVGDGVFFRSLQNNYINISNAVAIDVVDDHFDAISKIGINNLVTIKQDFLEYDTNERFSLIVGNPPYIKKSLLSEQQNLLCNNIYKNSGFNNNIGGNIWTAFMISALIC